MIKKLIMSGPPFLELDIYDSSSLQCLRHNVFSGSSFTLVVHELSFQKQTSHYYFDANSMPNHHQKAPDMTMPLAKKGRLAKYRTVTLRNP